MDLFDYDNAVQQINSRRRPPVPPNLSNKSTPSSDPSHPPPRVYLPYKNDRLRILYKPEETDQEPACPTANEVREVLERKYQMEEPTEAKDFTLWTSIVPSETFAIKEFPTDFKEVRGSTKYRFRKHYWGIAGVREAEQSDSPDTDETAGPGLYPALMKEISALRTLGTHPHCVSLLDIFFLGSTPCDISVILVFDDWGCTLRDLLSFPDAAARFERNPSGRLLIFRQLLHALVYLTSKRIIHRNITTTSVKMDRTGRLRLGNFNYAISADVSVRAAPFPEEDIPICSPDTYDHLAPEILFGHKGYGVSSDMWSAGLLLVELYLLRSLYDHDAGPDVTQPDGASAVLCLCEPHRRSSLPLILNLCRILGTPTRENFGDQWKLPFYHLALPNWPRTLEQRLDALPEVVRRLVIDILQYNPSDRPSVLAAQETIDAMVEH